MADNPKAKEYIQTKPAAPVRSGASSSAARPSPRSPSASSRTCDADLGIDHLKPLILRDVADTVGMHESTISRVTSNKYAHAADYKYFFNSAIKRGTQEDIASESVKQAITARRRRGPQNPYSDQKRRAFVATRHRYRTANRRQHQCLILSSSKRKKY